jgi:hypothetical protein
MPGSSHRSLRSGIVVMLALLASTSCMSLGRSSFQGDRGFCVSRPELAGVWRSRRDSQIGASRVTLKLDCDCRYHMTVSMPFGKMTEDGEYRIEDAELVFSRSNGATSWPFRITGETLVITEGETEAHEYARIAAGNCSTE